MALVPKWPFKQPAPPQPDKFIASATKATTLASALLRIKKILRLRQFISANNTGLFLATIPFDLENLFPLLPENKYSYLEEQQHSVLVDDQLGFNTTTIEADLIKDLGIKTINSEVQAWVGLPVQAMQTPYSELRMILELLAPQPGNTVIDLGCAYGRMAHVIGHHYPLVNFIGYELVAKRVCEGQRVLNNYSYPHCRIETADLSSADFNPPPAEYYFIFDFGSRSAIEKILEDLKRISLKKQITIVARGRGIRNWIYQGHPWLYSANEAKSFERFSIFQP